MMLRKPVVAGVFYPVERDALAKTIKECFLGPLGPGDLPQLQKNPLPKPVGLIVPHAGYMYSGQVAAWGYYELSKKGRPHTVVLIGPNHTGYGKPVSIYPSGAWKTPFGDVKVNEDGVHFIIENSKFVEADFNAHRMEHSLEVQLPFLQYLYGDDFMIIPITMMDQSPEAVVDLSKALLRYLSIYPNTLVVASTDLNHYDSHETTLKKDSLIIEAIEKNDTQLLYDAVYVHHVSACGYGAIATLMLLGLGRPRILKHATSGEVSGDYLEVVGYLSVIYE